MPRVTFLFISFQIVVAVVAAGDFLIFGLWKAHLIVIATL